MSQIFIELDLGQKRDHSAIAGGSRKENSFGTQRPPGISRGGRRETL
jgi:hypothetical protein